MSEKFALVLLLVLILAVPCAPMNSGVASDWAQGTAPFTLADDGDTSSDSITSFSETTDDDILFYPDAFLNNTPVVANTGSYTGDQFQGTWESTLVIADIWGVGDSTNPAEPEMFLEFPTPTQQVDGFIVNVYGHYTYTGTVGTNLIGIYDGATYDDIGDLDHGSPSVWTNSSVYYDPDYWQSDVVKVKIEVTSDNQVAMYVPCVQVQFYVMTLADSNHFGEGFNDVSDWAIQTGNTITSDGDLGSFHVDGDNVWDYYYTNSPSLANMKGYYAEFVYSANVSDSLIRVYGFALDDHAGTSYVLDAGTNLFPTATAKVLKVYLSHDVALESIRVHIKAPASDTEVKFDLFRVYPATEGGWSHDGSTTEGVVAAGGGTISSDGDILNCTADADGSTFQFWVDTTATASMLEPDYYPFIHLQFDTASNGMSFRLDSYDGSGLVTLKIYTVIDTTDYWVNLAAVEQQTEYILLTAYASQTLSVEVVQAFGIANYSYSASGVGTDDYLYVDSGTLYSNMDDGTIELNRDPALSISDTYSVYNLSTSGTAPEFSQYVSGWSTYSDDTRGATTSGTVTDIKLRFDSTEDISSIKFIEDGTAPDADIVATPTNPYDDESVTLSSIVFDTVEVYKVWFKAITYPDGFSDQDYEATEGQENYWSYTFAAGDLIVGDYCFKVIANDGANNSTISLANRDYATVRFTVREATLRVDNWRIDVGSAEVSGGGYCNKDASVAIYEDPEKDGTYVLRSSTSVSTGTFAFYWTRYDDTEAGDVRYAVKFTNSSETWWENGTYARALSESFVVESWDIDLHLGQQNYVEFDVLTSFENATIYAYDNDTLMATATESAGGVSSYFWMDTGSGIHIITLNITHGATTYTKTKSYYVPDWADGGLVVRLDIWTFQNNYTLLTLESNWMNCTFYVYLNDSLVATSYNDPVTLNITRTLNVGTFNLTIFADGGTQTYTISNIRYIVTEDGVSYDYSSVSSSGGVITYEGDEYEGDTFGGDTYEGVSGTDMATVVLELIVFMTLVVIVVAGVTYRDRRNRDDEIYKAQIAAGGYA